MGEITEMHLDGTLCQVCGSLNEDLIQNDGNDLLPSPGYPITCEECENK